jgi:hypothetical protein
MSVELGNVILGWLAVVLVLAVLGLVLVLERVKGVMARKERLIRGQKAMIEGLLGQVQMQEVSYKQARCLIRWLMRKDVKDAKDEKDEMALAE